MIEVCLLGTGGMMPLPGRPLTALLLRYNGHSFLVDCGEGTQVSIREYAWSMHSIDVICFTHFHGDHVAGISGLLSSMGTEGRTEPVHILGPKRIEEVIAHLCIVVRVPFDVIFHEIDQEPMEFFGVEITPFPVKHSVPCYGYRFDVSRRPRFFPEKAKQLGIPVQDWKKLQAGESIKVDGKRIDPEQVSGPARRGLSVVYSTDTRPCCTLQEAAYDVDLLITEGIYGDEEKLSSAKTKMHMTSREAAELSLRAGARKVWLTHYSPSFRDQSRYIREIRQINPAVSFGIDGKKTILQWEETTTTEENQ